jgi:hypothetical protein
MNREFVPYEIAVELKGLRFDEPCFAWFGPTGKFNDWDTTDTIAPLYQQAFRFFREKYALHASIHADLFHSEGMAAAGQIVQGLEPIQREINQSWDTAEEANLKADSRGIKTAPTSQVSQVLRLFRDFNTDF